MSKEPCENCCEEGKDPGRSYSHKIKNALEILGYSLDELERYVTAEEVVERPFTVKLGGKDRELSAIRVRHNSRRGPTKGGMRFHPSLDCAEAGRLAALMTWKCSLARLPFGGGKGGVAIDTSELSHDEVCQVARACTDALQNVIGAERDIWAPDIGTDSSVMKCIVAEAKHLHLEHPYAVTTGKPVNAGGLEAREGATALGAAYIFDQALDCLDLKPTTAAIQGIGKAGKPLARHLHDRGVKIIALSDSSATLIDESGLDLDAVFQHKKKTGSLKDGPGETHPSDQILRVNADVLGLAATGGQINRDNHSHIQAQLILELSNAGIELDIEEHLLDRGIEVMPDLLVNSGGVIMSYLEWKQNINEEKLSVEECRRFLHQTMSDSFDRARELQTKHRISLRDACFCAAIEGLQS